MRSKARISCWDSLRISKKLRFKAPAHFLVRSSPVANNNWSRWEPTKPKRTTFYQPIFTTTHNTIIGSINTKHHYRVHDHQLLAGQCFQVADFLGAQSFNFWCLSRRVVFPLVTVAQSFWYLSSPYCGVFLLGAQYIVPVPGLIWLCSVFFTPGCAAVYGSDSQTTVARVCSVFSGCAEYLSSLRLKFLFESWVQVYRSDVYLIVTVQRSVNDHGLANTLQHTAQHCNTLQHTLNCV